MGGRQVDDDAVDREFQAHVADGRAHPVPILTHPRVREADRYSRSGQHNRFGYLLEVPGVTRS
jgi:hypothetical protein